MEKTKYSEKYEYYKSLSLSFTRMQEKAAAAKKAAKKKKSSKKLGSVTVSNTDTVERCMRIKARLYAKLNEIYGSNVDMKMKQVMARNIMLQVEKVDVKITEIKRRDKAVLEERKRKKNESEEERRKRREDMEKRSTTIKREYLFSAKEGGYDPSDPVGASEYPGVDLSFEMPAVTAEISGADIPAPSVVPTDMSDVSLEVSV